MYNEFYGFSENPFELIQDPTSLFLTPGHQETIASIIDGLRDRRSFISVTGEAGTGKTSLIRFLISRLEAEEKVKTVLIFHPTITFEELLRSILMELDLEVMNAGKKALLGRLNEYLTQRVERDKTLVIILDEAQDLSKEVMGEIEMLPKIERLQVVFIGQLEFEDKLNSQGLRHLKQKIGIIHQIKPLDEKESKNYMEHRLGLVGSSSSQIFTPKAISMICSHAQGIPRIINILCDNAFLMGYRLSRKKIDVDIIHKVIKSMESPPSPKTFFSKIVSVANEYRTFPPKLNGYLSKTTLIVLSIFCIGGFTLLIYRYLQPPAQVQDIKFLKTLHDDTKPSSTPLSPQRVTKEISKKETHQPASDLEPTSPEFPKLISPMPTPRASISRRDVLGEMITIKEGQTIHSITRKYYRMVNKTLMDLILVSNPEITDVDLILVDQKIRIPKITEELLIIKSPENTYKINAGTFQSPMSARNYSNEGALKGKRIEVLRRKVSPRETWYRVVIGGFGNEDEVLKMIDLLKEKDLLPAFGGLSKVE